MSILRVASGGFRSSINHGRIGGDENLKISVDSLLRTTITSLGRYRCSQLQGFDAFSKAFEKER